MSITISDKYRPAITVDKRENGSIVLRGHFRGCLELSPAEVARIAGVALNQPYVQRYPVMAPESPQAGE